MMFLKVSKVGISWITTEPVKIDANERYGCRCGLHRFLYKGNGFTITLGRSSHLCLLQHYEMAPYKKWRGLHLHL